MLSRQAASAEVRELLGEDDEVTVWWGTWAECAVAISRLKHEGRLDDESEANSRTRLDRLAAEWVEIEPANDLRLLASIISKDHHLKTADCFQLAAALRWCEGGTDGRSFVCLDERLRRAATEEGFGVLPGASGVA